jgi:hypothetical protein
MQGRPTATVLSCRVSPGIEKPSHDEGVATQGSLHQRSGPGAVTLVHVNSGREQPLYGTLVPEHRGHHQRAELVTSPCHGDVSAIRKRGGLCTRTRQFLRA